ncbi:hypothetical protein PIROE2DRAFT_1692 [Piromyces sp. E2]|nr:hypothetical protein PIROE2DRAFT_1692 [Piromyces sp. E2]|eukprot:OUM70274.1 hypothetical protein PIROE2DRAFT_1692 [Piromyces sp. E2]
MTIVDDVYYYVVKYEDAKKVIENIKNKLKVKVDDIKPKTPLSPLFITPIPEVDEENTDANTTENSENNRHHIRSKSSPIQFVSNISSRAPRSIQRLLVRTGMAPLQAYPELMTRNNLRLIMKPEGLEPDPIMNSATISNDEFNSDDLYDRALNQNKFLTKIRNTLGKKKEEPSRLEIIHEVYSSSVGLLEEAGLNGLTEEQEETKEEEKKSTVATDSKTETTPSIVVSEENKPSINTTNVDQKYSQYVIDLGNSVMKNEKSTSPKSAISSCPYPAYSNNLLKVQTRSFLNDRDSKLSVYDWIKVHSTSPLSANNERVSNLFKTVDSSSDASSDKTKNAETCINVDGDDTEKKENDPLNAIKEIIFEAKFYATDDDFLMKSNVRAYFKHNALEPDDAVLFTLPSLVDNVVMLDGEQHPALLNFNYVLDRQMQNEARVLRKINKSLKWLLLAYLIFAFILIKVWVPTNVVIIIIAIGIFLICFFLMICAI